MVKWFWIVFTTYRLTSVRSGLMSHGNGSVLLTRAVSYFVFTVGENSQAMKLVYSVQFRAGSKVLTIGSDLVVRNDTTSPVEINLTDVHGKTQALLGPVGVGEQRAVPVG